MRRLRERLYYEQAGYCGECGEWMPRQAAAFDHIIPKSAGGPETWGNGSAVCRPCNELKADMVPSDLRRGALR